MSPGNTSNHFLRSHSMPSIISNDIQPTAAAAASPAAAAPAQPVQPDAAAAPSLPSAADFGVNEVGKFYSFQTWQVLKGLKEVPGALARMLDLRGKTCIGGRTIGDEQLSKLASSLALAPELFIYDTLVSADSNVLSATMGKDILDSPYHPKGFSNFSSALEHHLQIASKDSKRKSPASGDAVAPSTPPFTPSPPPYLRRSSRSSTQIDPATATALLESSRELNVLLPRISAVVDGVQSAFDRALATAVAAHKVEAAALRQQLAAQEQHLLAPSTGRSAWAPPAAATIGALAPPLLRLQDKDTFKVFLVSFFPGDAVEGDVRVKLQDPPPTALANARQLFFADEHGVLRDVGPEQRSAFSSSVLGAKYKKLIATEQLPPVNGGDGAAPAAKRTRGASVGEPREYLHIALCVVSTQVTPLLAAFSPAVKSRVQAAVGTRRHFHTTVFNAPPQAIANADFEASLRAVFTARKW